MIIGDISSAAEQDMAALHIGVAAVLGYLLLNDAV